MESAGKRHSRRKHAAAPSVPQPPTFGLPIPSFTVNLSQPPQDRYSHIPPHLPDLDPTIFEKLFDDILNDVLPAPLTALVRKSASILLRRLYSDEETAELLGISRITSIPMYLLVAFNVLLDLLLGCTSGGVLVEEPTEQGSGWKEAKMLHFRTLDWGMDPLRQLVVKLDYVREEGGEVVASTVGYFGYVGVLTGVRKGLSMSLNFRPYHNASTLRKRIAFRRHQVAVLLGLRPSVSSVLRRYLLSEAASEEKKEKKDTRERSGMCGTDLRSKKDSQDETAISYMRRILDELNTSSSTAAYLIFCIPDRVYSVEKDNRSAFIRSSNTFLTTYNHDAIDESDPEAIENAARRFNQGLSKATSMDEVVAFGTERKARMDKMHAKRLRRHQRHYHRKGEAVGLEDVYAFVSDSWITNDETHYTVVMDPKDGSVVWSRKLEADSELESSTDEDVERLVQD